MSRHSNCRFWMGRRGAFAGAALVWALSWPDMGWASGALPPSKGVRNQGMGGVGIAQTTDVTSLDANPALLTTLRGTKAYVNYHGFIMDSSMERIGENGEAFPKAKNVANRWNHVPNVFFGSDFGLDDAYFSAGVFSPIGPRHTYDPYGAQRYSIIRSQISLFWAAAGAAYRPAPWISVGATAMLGFVIAQQVRAVGLSVDHQTLDGNFTFDGSGGPFPTGEIGVALEPFYRSESLRPLRFGLLYRHRMQADVEGTVNVSIPALGLNGSDEVVVAQPIPEEVRVGAAWVDGPYTFEIASRWLRWSIYKELTLNLKRNNVGGVAIDDLTVPKDYRDTMSLNAGGEYRLDEMHRVRAGYYYDMSAIGDASVGLTEFDSNTHGISAGYGMVWKGLTVDTSFLYTIMPARKIANSGDRAIAAIGEAPIVGNGVVDWNVYIFGVGVGYAFE